MKLLSVTLKDFKSIHEAVVSDLAAINILFGPTNSGKTSFLESVFFQFFHQNIVQPKKYFEFLHSKANPKDGRMEVRTEWRIEEPFPEVNLHVNDDISCITSVRFFGTDDPKAEDQLLINGRAEGNPDRQRAVFQHLQKSVKLSSSRRPGDSKQAYYADIEETADSRKQRFLRALQDLELQGGQYEEFLSHLQKMFPHLVYGATPSESIVEFFGMGFLGTAKLFSYLFDARYTIVLVDEPEIHFYPSLTRRFVQALHEAVEKLEKQILIATHSTLFLRERRIGNFYHITKSKHYQTQVRKVEQGNLLQGIDLINRPPEAILESDVVIYTEGPWDVGVMEEFIAKYEELNHVNIVVLQLGGGSMGNINVDPVKLKMHNPLSFVIIDSERQNEDGKPDPAHQTFLERCYKAKVFCLMLERQAMENYFTPRALREVYHAKMKPSFQNKPYKPLARQGLSWYTKDGNRAVARAMTREEIESFPDLKRFFDELIHVSAQVQ